MTAPTPARDTSFRLAGLPPVVAGGALFLVTVLVYWPALQGGLIMDDLEHITAPKLRPWSGLARIWFEIGATAHYYPLLNSVFWIEHRLWGDAVLGYHLVNVLQHAASACLVVAIVRRLALPGAWLAGMIFAMHPVCVESVAWISEQKNTLSGLFFLAAGFVYLGFDAHRRNSRYWLALGFFVLALLTKSVTATLPAVLLVIFWWQRGKLEWKRDVRPLLPWFVIGASMGLVSAWFEATHSNAQGAAFDLDFIERSLIAGRAIVFYAHTFLWPADLMFINPRWTIDASAAWQYLYPLAVLAVAAGLLWFALVRGRRGPLAAFLVFTGTLFPMLGFLNINWFVFSFVADHFQYLSTLGLIVPVAGGLTLAGRRLTGVWIQRAAAAVLIIVLGALTWQQSSIYRDAETLYRHTLARNPACWVAHNNLGSILAAQPGRLDEAVGHFQETLRLKPDHVRAHNNLGFAYSVMPDRRPDAIAAFRGSLRLQPGVASIHRHLAHALAQSPGREAEAVGEYQNALRLDSSLWEAHVGLGDLLSDVDGAEAGAIVAYRAAIKLRPENAITHNSLASVLANTPGGIPEAITEFETALRLKPDYVEAHFNLGLVLADIPARRADAIKHLDTAARLAPDWEDPRRLAAELRSRVP